MISACTGQVGEDQVVDPGLDVGEDRRGDRHRGGEVEPEAARRVLRARLGRGVAQRLTERLVDHVGGRVRAADRATPLDVDERVGLLADQHLAGEHLDLVHDEAADRRLDVEDLEPRPVAELEDALVGELAAALGVERRPVEDQLDLVPLARRVGRAGAGEDAAHGGLADHLVVAGELDRAAEGVGERTVVVASRRAWPASTARRPWRAPAAGPSAGGTPPRRPRAPARRPSRGSGRSGSRRCRGGRTPCHRRGRSPRSAGRSPTATSKIWVPARSVDRNASSSA